MAWWNLSSDIAGAVTKLSESVKSIERNFDSALGLEGTLPAVTTDPATSAADLAHGSKTSSSQTPDAGDVSVSVSVPDVGSVADEQGNEREQGEVEVEVEAKLQGMASCDPSATPPQQCERAGEEQEALVLVPAAAAVGETDESTAAVVEEASDSESKLKMELRMMEQALQGAAKQAQVKADELARLTQENDSLRHSLEETKKRTSDVELEALRQEYQQQLGAAERKVYALAKERDMLRREQNRKSDSTALLKEKDEIIKQVMAEGEELSKKQAAQESQIRKLRTQVRELEEEKQRLNSKLQVEEAKAESMRKDKSATEKVLQETVEKGHADLAAQREFYTKIVNEAREAEARAEARANSQAKADLDQRLQEAAQRESALVQVVEELRQSLSRAEQQAAYREDVLRKDIESLEKRCQDAETRYDDLVARVPESTRPLLRQIEAMQESSAMRAEAWSGVERALNARLQEAEAKAAAAVERERATNERLSQMLSRLAVMEAQVSCVKAELSQVTRSLETERARASESRQEYLAAVEAAVTHEGHAKVLQEEVNAVKEEHARVLGEERLRRLALEQELEKERTMRAEAEQRMQKRAADASPRSQQRRLPSLTSVNGMEEGQLLQVSLDPQRPRVTDMFPASPQVARGSLSLEQFEAVMRHKEGELSSYISRLAELESTRAALAEELVRSTSECEKLRSEASTLRALRSELEALRRRHASALELMGERDEQVEELRADLADVKQMYREQIDMLVSQLAINPVQWASAT